MRGDIGIDSRSTDDPASKEKRIRVLSAGLAASARRLPVLRFLGRLRILDRGGEGDLCKSGVDFETSEEPRIVQVSSEFTMNDEGINTEGAIEAEQGLERR